MYELISYFYFCVVGFLLRADVWNVIDLNERAGVDQTKNCFLSYTRTLKVFCSPRDCMRGSAAPLLLQHISANLRRILLAF